MRRFFHLNAWCVQPFSGFRIKAAKGFQQIPVLMDILVRYRFRPSWRYRWQLTYAQTVYLNWLELNLRFAFAAASRLRAGRDRITIAAHAQHPVKNSVLPGHRWYTIGLLRKSFIALNTGAKFNWPDRLVNFS